MLGPAATEPSEEYRVPTITIKRLESEKIEERPTAIKGEKITWRLDADPAPLKDVVVHVSIPSANNQSVDVWIIIPKIKPYSEEFTNTIYGGAIEVVALPMLSIVGKGLVVNVEKLREGLPTDTYGGHQIPKDFDFPLYHVGNPSQILCDDCSAPVPPLSPFFLLIRLLLICLLLHLLRKMWDHLLQQMFRFLRCPVLQFCQIRGLY